MLKMLVEVAMKKISGNVIRSLQSDNDKIVGYGVRRTPKRKRRLAMPTVRQTHRLPKLNLGIGHTVSIASMASHPKITKRCSITKMVGAEFVERNLLDTD
jgi:hypothetical protein